MTRSYSKKLAGSRNNFNKKEKKEISKEQIAKGIKGLCAIRGEKMAHWASELGVSRTAVYHVIAGRSESRRIKKWLEEHLKFRFWS